MQLVLCSNKSTAMIYLLNGLGINQIDTLYNYRCDLEKENLKVTFTIALSIKIQ